MKSFIEGDFIDISRSGNAFHASAYFTVLNAGTNYFQIKTSATEDVVVLDWAFVTNTQPMRFTALEAPTVTNGTTPVASLNLNRLSTHTSSVTLYSDPTSVSAGTTLVDLVTPAGANKIGGSLLATNVWTLKKDTSYVVKIENLGNNNSECTFNMTWMES